MSNSISTLLIRNLHDVFGDAVTRLGLLEEHAEQYTSALECDNRNWKWFPMAFITRWGSARRVR